MSVDPMLLLQRQMEVAGMVRAPPKTAAELVRVKQTMTDLVKFITLLGRTSTRLGLPLELAFQALLAIGMGSEQSFDKQHSQGHVPMHQAKVLNRDAANSVAPTLKEKVPPADLEDMVHKSQLMRTFLRIKVEDANDLSQARRGLTLGDEYFGSLGMLANDDPDTMWALYNAQDEGSIRAILKNAPGDSASSLTGGSDSDAGGAATKPLPKNLAAGIQHECSESLMTSTVAVPKRMRALDTIAAWLEEVGNDVIRAKMGELCVALRGAMKVQLGEKRSAITRAACNVFTKLASAATPASFAQHEVKDTVTVWLGVLLKQVHVTVGAIAEASDATVRDVVVASHGASYVCAAIAAALSAGAQPELQRKCVGYLALALVASSTDMTAKAHVCTPAVDKMLRSGNEGIRRVARAFGIVLEQRYPQGSLPSWDDRCEKVAMDERPTIIGLMEKGVAAFEVGVLRYPAACTVAQAPPANDLESPVRHGHGHGHDHHSAASSNTPTPTHPASRGAPTPNATSRPREVPSLTKRPQPHQVSSGVEDSSPTQIPDHAASRSQPRPQPLQHRTPVAPCDSNVNRMPTSKPPSSTGAKPATSTPARVTPLTASRLTPSHTGSRPGSGVPLSLASLSTERLAAVDDAKDPLSSLKAKRRTPSRA